MQETAMALLSEACKAPLVKQHSPELPPEKEQNAVQCLPDQPALKQHKPRLSRPMLKRRRANTAKLD